MVLATQSPGDAQTGYKVYHSAISCGI